MFSFVNGTIDFAHKLDAASLPTESYYKHVHAFNELIFFVDGDVDYTVESEMRHLFPSDLILIPAGKYHFATVNSAVRYERYVLKFPNSVLPKFLVERIGNMSSFFSGLTEQASVFSKFDSYYEFGNFSDEELVAMFTSDVIKLLIMLSKAPADTPRQTNAVIAEMVKYIDENLTRPISLESLSEEFHFSKSYISNEFKQYMKIPIMQYVRMKKVIAAHQLILAGEKKAAVAERFGFENYSTFYRQYLKLYRAGMLLVSP